MKPVLVGATLYLLSSAHAGFAPADNPTVTVFKLPDKTTLSTDFDNRNVLSYSIGGRVRWTLGAKNTPVTTFDSATVRIFTNGTFWLCGAKEMEVRELATGARRFRAALRDNIVQDAQLEPPEISPDGTRVALGGSVKESDKWTDCLRVFDLRSGAPLQQETPRAFPRELRWTSNTRLEIKGTNEAAFAPKGSLIPGVPADISQEFDVSPAPTSFVAPVAKPAGAVRVAAKTSKAPRKEASTKRQGSR